MQAFEPVCRRIVADLASRRSAPGEVERMGEFAREFAPVPGKTPVKATHPASGLSSLPLRIAPA